MTGIVHQIPFGTPSFDELLALRDRILRKPLKLEFNIIDIEEEFDQIHLAYYHSSCRLMGCLTFHILDDSVLKMRQVAIDKPFQRKGVGSLLVQEAENWALINGYTKIVLNARDVSLGFYQKLGYKKVGRPFKEVGIKHYKMEKKWLG
ncbi:MAG TPA: GNAT family N-acetyltransferase [Saprospiraceae bacterium]|nr:GNAT family N-acetyltransferase [Saprospiraceae bacterium]